MISVEEAIQRILAVARPLSPPLEVPLSQALGTFAAAPIASAIPLPLFDNSAMDGYAIRSADLQHASPQNPVTLRCTQRTAAGEYTAIPLETNTCARVFTGSAIPPGSDAVVMQEDVRAVESGAIFTETPRPLENIRLQGEDVRQGQELLKAGDRITPLRLGLLAATGHARVSVFPRCTAALLATGSELREPGEELARGQIFESNRTTLQGLLTQMGVLAETAPLIRDDLAATIAALRSSFERSDVVISTGGVSVGEYDFVKEAFRALGGTLDFWQIAMRPGKPFVFGNYRGKLFFGLPGNPVSAFVTFMVLVRPPILKMQGSSAFFAPEIPGELTMRIANPSDRRHFFRVRWEHGKISLAGPQKSHMIGTLGEANALLDVPPGAVLEAGKAVPVFLWDLPPS